MKGVRLFPDIEQRAPDPRGLELRHEKPGGQGKPDQIKPKGIGHMIPSKPPIQ